MNYYEEGIQEVMLLNKGHDNVVRDIDEHNAYGFAFEWAIYKEEYQDGNIYFRGILKKNDDIIFNSVFGSEDGAKSYIDGYIRGHYDINFKKILSDYIDE